MFRISACYGRPSATDAFHDHYDNVHTPLVLRIPGLARLTTGMCQPLAPDQDPPYYMVAGLIFESVEDLETALNSPEMAAASADVRNFATGGMTAFRTEEINRS